MNRLFILIVFVFFSSLSFAQQQCAVLFDSDSHRLTPFQTEKINVLLSQLKGEPCSVSIFGHTDSDASDVYNLRLSEQRMKAVRAYIEKHFQQITINETAFYGEENPVASNNKNDTKAQNRRVEIILNCKAKKEEKEVLQDVWTSINQIQPTPTDLHFDGAKGGTFALKNGARISIAPNTFPNGQINLKVNECVTIGDMLAYGLTTQSNETGDGLQSSGMYRVQAFQNNRRLPNLNSNDIVIYVPVDTSDYQTFDAVQNGQYTEWNARSGGDDKFLKPYTSLCELAKCDVETKSRNVAYNYFTCRFFWCKVKSFFSRNYKQDRSSYVYTQIMMNPNFDAIYDVYKLELDKEFGSEKGFAEFVANSTYSEILEKMNNMFPRFTKDVFYAMQMPNYSWVNCDRFTGYSNLTTVSVNEAADPNKDIRLYFKKMKCVMRPNKSGNNKSKFRRVPVGQIATLVIIKRVNDVLMMSSDDFKIGEKPKVNFKPVKTDDMQKVLLN